MIVKERSKMYTSKRTMIHGHGYVDTMKGIGSYISQNKDLIAKPMLGAVGDLAAFAAVQGGKTLIKKIISKKDPINAESRQIIDYLQTPLTSEMVGSGIKRY